MSLLSTKYKYIVAVPLLVLVASGLILANTGGENRHRTHVTQKTTTQSASRRCPHPAAECNRIRQEHKELQVEVKRLKKDLTLEKRMAATHDKKATDIERKLRKGREAMVKVIRRGMTEDDLKDLLGRVDAMREDPSGGFWLTYDYIGKDNRDRKYQVHLDKSKKVDIWLKGK